VEAVSKCLAFSGYKAREDERAEGGKDGKTEKPLEKHRTRGRIEKTFIPLFLLKETEEATERDHKQRRKKAASPPVLHHVFRFSASREEVTPRTQQDARTKTIQRRAILFTPVSSQRNRGVRASRS